MSYTAIQSYDNYISANLALSLLKESGVDCYIKDEYIITIDPLLSPALGGMKLMVDTNDEARAQDILQQSLELYLETIDCPVCHHNTLRYVTRVTEFDTWGGRLKSMLLNGQEQEVKKFYHCDTCKHEFTELPLAL